MAAGWIPSVKQTHRLSIYWGPSVHKEPWAPVRHSLFQAFQSLSQLHGLGVTLVPGQNPPTQPGGANVSITAIAGSHTSTLAGQTFSVTVPENALAGETIAPEGPQGILAAAIFLPAHPKIMTPKALRGVGPNVLLHILLHELLHACGLETHTSTGLFQANPHVEAGTTPAGDRTRGAEGAGAPYMPPFYLDPSSVSEFKRTW